MGDRSIGGPSKGLRDIVLRAARKYHLKAFPKRTFVPGVTRIPAAGKVFDAEELVHLVDSALDFWLTSDRYASMFEDKLGRRLGLRHIMLTNSGSSANLLALSALTAKELGDEGLRPGDEVITTAASFPTTVNPIIQNGLRPVFVDVHIPTYNAIPGQIEAAISSRTKAIVLAHALGNPFDLKDVLAIASKHRLWLIEDCCDALGARYAGRPVATFGDLATFSFYPAHHITMGEGGAVATNEPRLRRLVESFRDWGRDCWCSPGSDDTCAKRFQWKLGDLIRGYDHKYIYTHAGYNLKLTDMQAAIGVAQLGKLSRFLASRRRNFNALYQGLKRYEDHLIMPQATRGAEPAWFGFPLCVREEATFSREMLTGYLESQGIGTRLLFAGNIVRQPYFKGIRYRKVGSLENSDAVMRSVFWIGVYPGITENMLDYILDRFARFFRTIV